MCFIVLAISSLRCVFKRIICPYHSGLLHWHCRAIISLSFLKMNSMRQGLNILCTAPSPSIFSSLPGESSWTTSPDTRGSTHTTSWHYTAKWTKSSFQQNTHYGHPTAHPYQWAMGCLLRVQILGCYPLLCHKDICNVLFITECVTNVKSQCTKYMLWKFVDLQYKSYHCITDRSSSDMTRGSIKAAKWLSYGRNGL